VSFTHSQTDRATLLAVGARVNVRIFAFTPEKAASPHDGVALIDTGADSTCIDTAVARRLGYPQTDSERVAHAKGTSEHPVFPITFEFLGLPFPPWKSQRLIGVDLRATGLCMLLGRDFLADAHLIYNGAAGLWCLEYPAPPRAVERCLPTDSPL
jgi:hypothetical protein